MSLLHRISLGVLLLGLGVADTALAQFGFPVQPLGRIVCTYSAVPNQVRSEGLAERTGDARLDCVNDGVFNPLIPNQMQQYVLANITVSLNTAVTNMLNVGGDGGNVTDAVLVVNDNNNIRPVAGSLFPYQIFPVPIPAPEGCSIAELDPFMFVDPRYPCPQKGILSGSNSLTWNGVNFPVPGAPNFPAELPEDSTGEGVPDCVSSIFEASLADSSNYNDYCFNPVTTIRITNIRANAAAVGAGGAIFANLTIFSFAGISVTPSNQQTVANVFQGLLVDYDDPITGLQCEETHGYFYFELEEGFAGSFKTLGAPTFAQADAGAENGYPVCDYEMEDPISPPGQFNGGGCVDPQANAGTGGGATQATRFLLRFFGIPMGVELGVYDAHQEDWSEGGYPFGVRTSDCEVEPNEPGYDQDLCIERVQGADENGEGGVAVGGDSDYYEVGLDSDGNGYVVFELKNGDPFRTQSLSIPVLVWWEPDTSEDKPAIGSGQISVTFAPLSDEGAAGNFPAPRFIDTGGDPFTFLTIVRCSTTLLFPFVSNRFGFDTGFAISNTSMDWKGTAPQRGRCMIHYIGNTGDAPDSMPDDDITSIIEGGEHVTWTLSMGNPIWEINGAPDFQGFVVAMCEFQFAHGYAFITDATSAVPDFAQGYLALVMQFGVDSDGDLVRLLDCGSGFYKQAAAAPKAKGIGGSHVSGSTAAFGPCSSEALNQ